MKRDATDFPLETPDVLVVGGGAAGMIAAVAAARRGKRVVVLKKTEGATGLSSGAVDVADERAELVPGDGADPFASGGTVAEAAAWLAARRPRHPYARVGATGRARLSDALALLGEVASDVGLTPRDDARNRVLVTQLGTTKRAALAPRTAALDLSALEPGARLAIVDLADLGNFGAAPASAMLRWIAGLGGRDLDVKPLPIGRLPELARPFENGRQMAAWLDTEAHAAALVDAVKAAIARASERPTHLVFPAVLGLSKAAELHRALEEATGATVSEVLALPQSAPGARLSRALADGAEREGVRVVAGQALSAVREGGRIEVVHARGKGEAIAVRPGAVVLATGRFFAGGIVREGEAHEPLFGLPVVSEGVPVADRFVGGLLAERPEGEHAIFRAGLAYDAELRPLDERGCVFAENLFAAGSVLEGYDPAKDGSGLGVCVLTGLLAGERAAG